jgi:predicted nucleic acid-binding protein
MIRVVVDTNVMGGANWQPLESGELRRLLDETRRGNLQLVVPEIVLREAANLWAELVVDEATSHQRSLRILRQAGVIDKEHAISLDEGSIRAAEEKRIQDLVTAAGGLIPSIPEISQDEVIERALRREQPFDQKGRNGYRDVILWESVLALEPGDPIVFIAKDKRAFYEDSKYEKGLAVALTTEVNQRLGDEQAFSLFYEPDRGTDAVLKQANALAEAKEKAELAAQRAANEEARQLLNERLRTDEGFRLLVTDAVAEALNFWDLGHDLREYGLRDGEVDGALIDVVETFNSFEFIAVHLSQEGEAYVEFRSDISASADASMHPAAAVLLEHEPQVSIREQGYDSGVAEAQIEVAARVVADLVIEPETGKLLSLATISQFEPLSLQDLST